MKTPFVSFRKIFGAAVASAAILFASLPTVTSAETVHSATYQRSGNFSMTFFASHDDNAPTGNVLYVTLTITIRDSENNVVSSSSLEAELTEGEVYVYPYEDVGMNFNWFDLEWGISDGFSEVSVSADFGPPGALTNYSVEVSLTKTSSDGNEDSSYVSYEVF